MALKIPSRSIAGWASDIVAQCSVSQNHRVQRGNYFNSLFLTGAYDGGGSTFNKTNIHVSNLAAYLYSPTELRFHITPTDPSQSDWRAMATGATQLLHQFMRSGDVDVAIDSTVIESCVKGKAFLQLLWTENGFEPYVVQPEVMGVLREDLPTLDQQEAFFLSTYMTLGQFRDLVERHPDKHDLLRKVRRHVTPRESPIAPQNLNVMKQIVLGGGFGNQPVRSANDSASGQQGILDWITNTSPQFDQTLISELIRLDEIWVQDADENDWTTLQTIGDDIIIEGKYLKRNLFADPSGLRDQELIRRSKESNPLSGHQPFIEFCPNPVRGYFWGRSEVYNVHLLQLALNGRIDGINALLRRQENPPWKIIGGKSANQNIIAKINKPGGWFSDTDPNVKIESLAPQIPEHLWADVHEIEKRFDEMGGFTPTLQGRGDSGVRARSQAESLVRTGSPRFKTRALRIERSVEAVGSLGVDLLKARYPKKVAAWARPNANELSAAPQSWWKNLWNAPAPNMKRIEFLMADLPSDWSVRVDSHSSSPAFSHESKELAFALAKAGAIGSQDLISLTHPPHEEALALSAESKELERAEAMRQNPQLMLEQAKGKKK